MSRPVPDLDNNFTGVALPTTGDMPMSPWAGYANETLKGMQTFFDDGVIPRPVYLPVNSLWMQTDSLGVKHLFQYIGTNIDVELLRIDNTGKASIVTPDVVTLTQLGSFPSTNLAYSQTVAGNYSWTAPDVYAGKNYWVEMWLKGAGGGGAGNSYPQAGSLTSGPGGGEGELIKYRTLVTPGQVYPIVLGLGGAGGFGSASVGATSYPAANGTSSTAFGLTAAFGLLASPGASGNGGGLNSFSATLIRIMGAAGGNAMFSSGATSAQGGIGGGGRRVSGTLDGLYGDGGSGGAAAPTRIVGGKGGDGYCYIWILGPTLA